MTKVNESNARVTNDRRTNYYSKLGFRSPHVNKFWETHKEGKGPRAGPQWKKILFEISKSIKEEEEKMNLKI